LLLLNGAFRYAPNLEALENLVFQINPLLQKEGFPYQILVCGMDIPEKFKNTRFPNLMAIGYVKDIETYLKGCQVFLNPVIRGAGIKTKLVEALGYNLNSVSTENGSVGIDPVLCNGKLLVCPDSNWEEFARLIRQMAEIQIPIPQAFYDHFYWDNIARRAAEFIQTGAAREYGI
ncbi:MAG TPA: glycosyltransferase family 4 protein, partial [Puia sp.]